MDFAKGSALLLFQIALIGKQRGPQGTIVLGQGGGVDGVTQPLFCATPPVITTSSFTPTR